MFEEVLQLIDRHENFLVSGHVHPDGDCLGTQVGLYHFLKRMGKTVHIVNAHAPEPAFDFLGQHTEFGVYRRGASLPPHEVHFITDCSTLDRLGSVGVEAAKLTGKTRVVVDHHVGSDQGDGDLLLWDVDACSSGAIVYDLFRKAGAPVSVEAGEGIFVSIVADTGWFHYSNTNDDALAISADLVAQGVQPHRIYNALYRRKPQQSVALLAEGLQLARFEADGKVALCALPGSFMRRVDKFDFNTDDLLDPLRSVDGVDVVVLLKERTDGRVKISLRASDRVDVDGVARSFGGGGHRKASGAELDGPLDRATAAVVDKVREIVGS